MISRMSRILFKMLGVLLIISSFGGAWLIMDFQQFKETPLNISGEGIYFNLQPGVSFSHFAQELADAGVLQHPRYLILLARWQGRTHQIKAGEYFIEKGTTGPRLIDQLISGAVILHAITLVDGWTFRQVMDVIAKHDAVEKTLTKLSDAQIMEQLGMAGLHPEGRFLPETYHFPRGTTDVAVLRRAAQAMQRILDEEWSARSDNLPYRNAYDALIMASIVEKESARHEERFDIAGVFVRRLQKGMRLQTDPTVIYGMGAGFNGNITRRDLLTNTPYNTYLNPGLPPTPISMPSRAAVNAALHPAPGKALYFVSRGDGTHQFSETLQEHNEAVRRYQLQAPSAAVKKRVKRK